MRCLTIGRLVLMFTGLLFTAPIFADEITVPVGQQGDQMLSRPSSGMSTQVVEQTFGAPEAIVDAIGEPPITIWKYAKYSVYFEYDRVIHTVLHKS